VARNGIKHGLLSRECIAKGENEADLVSFGKRLRAQLAPVGELELLLVDRIISTAWRLRRLLCIETIIFNTEGPALAYALRMLGREKLIVLSRYEVSLERSLYRYFLISYHQSIEQPAHAPINIALRDTPLENACSILVFTPQPAVTANWQLMPGAISTGKRPILRWLFGCRRSHLEAHPEVAPSNCAASGRRAALAAAKRRGTKLGNPHLAKASASALASIKRNADAFAKQVLPVIRDVQESGAGSLRAIARALEARGVPTVRGGQWTPVQVSALLRRRP
jgi:hypothetical protein